jgi:transposase
VDITRRAENKKLVKIEDKTLQHTKYLWLKNPKNFTEQDAQRLSEIIKANKAPNLINAYELKEEFKSFFDCTTTETATLFFKNWYEKVQKSNNVQLLKVAKMFQKHFDGMLNYIKHHVTNAIAEGLNSRIQQLKAKARGFKSAAAFRIAILFHFGKLYLYPT